MKFFVFQKRNFLVKKELAVNECRLVTSNYPFFSLGNAEICSFALARLSILRGSFLKYFFNN